MVRHQFNCVPAEASTRAVVQGRARCQQPKDADGIRLPTVSRPNLELVQI
jgi:hypothetical protein